MRSLLRQNVPITVRMCMWTVPIRQFPENGRRVVAALSRPGTLVGGWAAVQTVGWARDASPPSHNGARIAGRCDAVRVPLKDAGKLCWGSRKSPSAPRRSPSGDVVIRDHRGW